MKIAEYLSIFFNTGIVYSSIYVFINYLFVSYLCQKPPHTIMSVAPRCRTLLLVQYCKDGDVRCIIIETSEELRWYISSGKKDQHARDQNEKSFSFVCSLQPRIYRYNCGSGPLGEDLYMYMGSCNRVSGA